MSYTGYSDPSLGWLHRDRAFGFLGHGLIWLTFAVSCFVQFEPAPYDFLMAITVTLFLVCGLRVSAKLVPLILLLGAYVGGGFFASIVPETFRYTAENVAITGFLIGSGIFVAAYVSQNPDRNFTRILVGWSIAAWITSLAAIAGYFGLAGPLNDEFMIYSRARGTFEDPNVMAPFLVAPLLYAILRVLRGQFSDSIWAVPQILILSLALLLTFSRGGWGHAAFSGLVCGYFLFLTAPDIRQRVQLVIFGILGMSMLTMLGVIAISDDKVGELFSDRATLTQSYDTGSTGRFGRHLKAIELIIENPQGIGAKEFEKIYPEAPHNVYLNAFIISGWIGGIAYMLAVITTLWLGFKQLFIKVRWQGIYIVVYATYLGTALEGLIIDSDHWRHYFVLMGLIWAALIAEGGILASRRTFHPAPSGNTA